MSIWWCSTCGMEDTRDGGPCPSCGSALQHAGLVWLADGDEGEETVFELETEPMERAAIVHALVTGGIRHRWEGVTDLVVADGHVDAVDVLLDDILGADTRADVIDGPAGIPQMVAPAAEPDEYEEYDDDSEGEGDDQSYAVLSRLFVAVDRLQKRRNEDDVTEFVVISGEALALGPPFGVDEEVWAGVQANARNLATSLESDPEAEVDSDLVAFRNELQQMV